MIKDLIIAGAGAWGREVLQIVKNINRLDCKWNILGFINDIPDALDGYECDYSIIGTIEHWQPQEGQEFVCAIGDPLGKELVVKKLKARGAKFANIISPLAHISDYVEVGEGLILGSYSIISVNTKIGNFVTVSPYTGIGHDVQIGDYCMISSFCNLLGKSIVGEKAFLGSHSTILPHKKIGSEAYVAAGSVVVTNIKAGDRVFGNPARKMDF